VKELNANFEQLSRELLAFADFLEKVGGD